MSKGIPSAFVKNGLYEHNLFLQKEGLLYMNSLRYFAELEGTQFIGDALEHKTLRKTKLGPDIIVKKMDGAAINLKDFGAIPLSLDSSYAEDGPNIFSLSKLVFKSEKVDFEELADMLNGLKGEKDSWLLIREVDTFLARVKLAFEKLDLGFRASEVEYKELNRDDFEKDCFIKDAIFAHQKEYRIVTHKYFNKPFEIRVGDLSDITLLIECRDNT